MRRPGEQLPAPTNLMDLHFPDRRSTRLPGFDYRTAAGYFISLVTNDRSALFGRIVHQTVELSAAGQIIKKEWLRTPVLRPGTKNPPLPRSLPIMIAQFKATMTRRINALRGTPAEKVWQRGYHDRIIRNEVKLDKVRRYIHNNPRQR